MTREKLILVPIALMLIAAAVCLYLGLDKPPGQQAPLVPLGIALAGFGAVGAMAAGIAHAKHIEDEGGSIPAQAAPRSRSRHTFRARHP